MASQVDLEKKKAQSGIALQLPDQAYMNFFQNEKLRELFLNQVLRCKIVWTFYNPSK
jgi:hypothetical protein